MFKNKIKTKKVDWPIYAAFLPFLLLSLLPGCGQGDNKTGQSQEQTSSKSATPSEAHSVKNSVKNGVKNGVNNSADNEKTIIFFGNSLTAGYGVDPSEAFPALVQNKIDSLGLNYEVVNAGLSGETTASGKNRIEWILKQPVDIFVLELGANDGLRGINLEETEQNLQEIIDIVEETYPEAKIVLAGMQIPPSMGPAYTSRFKTIFPHLAEKNDIYLIPFLLEDVGGEPDLNQADGIHPNVEGHKILARNVWKVLREVL